MWKWIGGSGFGNLQKHSFTNLKLIMLRILRINKTNRLSMYYI